jgi:hypothetical protein
VRNIVQPEDTCKYAKQSACDYKLRAGMHIEPQENKEMGGKGMKHLYRLGKIKK